jgi:hypothetical protein
VWRIALHDRMAVSPREVAAWSWREVWEAHAALDAHDAMIRRLSQKKETT